MEGPPGTEGVFFPLPSRLVDLIRTASGQNILRGIGFQADHAHELLDRTGMIDWQRIFGLSWYNGNVTTVEPFPENLPNTKVAADAVLTLLGPLLSFALPRMLGT